MKTPLHQMEYLHQTLQECGNGNIDIDMIENSIEIVEQMREPLIEEWFEEEHGFKWKGKERSDDIL